MQDKSVAIYCIPGLGLDHRIFERLQLQRCRLAYLNWLEPLTNEALPDYARRMAESIAPEGHVVLVGYSFGGIVAQEIAAIRPISKIILLSSIKHRNELSPLFKRVALWGLYRVFRKRLVIRLIGLWAHYHGFDAKETVLFRDMIDHLSGYYYRWGLKSISSWSSPKLGTGTRLIHIHGTNDRPFPYKYLSKVDHVVQDGDHMMIYKQPETISELVLRWIDG